MGKYSIPCIISLLVAALYNNVDQIFIANASYLGSYGNAANTVVFPLTVIALAIAVMIGDGCCAHVSICLGGQNQKSAHKSIGNAIILCVTASLVLAVWYLCHMKAVQLEKDNFRLNKEVISHFIPLGVCSFLSQISLVAAMEVVGIVMKFSRL